jgi:ariadne-1
MDNPTSLLVAAGINVPEPSAAPSSSRTRPTDSSSASRRSSRGASRLLTSFGASKTKSPVTSPTLSHYTPRSFKPKLNEPFVCPICFDDSPQIRTLALDCEHTFCSGCWTTYLVSKIRDEGELGIKCMAEGCAMVCPDPFIHTLLVPSPGSPPGDPQQEIDNAKAWSHFQELLVRHYVASNKRLKFCPYPACTNTVSCPSAADKSSLTTVVPTVSCGARGIGGQMTQSQSQPSGLGLAGKEHKFCFGCHIESDHRPVVLTFSKILF